MTPFITRLRGRPFAFALACLCLSAGSIAPIAVARDRAVPAATSATAADLLARMAGSWKVTQRMRPGADAAMIALPPATAQRTLIGGVYLEEQMVATGEGAFTRTAYLNFNPVAKVYEYLSLDTRAPQQMRYASVASGEEGDRSRLRLQGGRFVAAQWGDAHDVAFGYRLELGAVDRDRQTLRLYLTPEAGAGAGREFLAFQYDYVRVR